MIEAQLWPPSPCRLRAPDCSSLCWRGLSASKLAASEPVSGQCQWKSRGNASVTVQEFEESAFGITFEEIVNSSASFGFTNSTSGLTKVVSGLAKVVSGFTDVVSEFTNAQSGFTKVSAGLTKVVSGFTKVVSRFANVVSGFTKVVSGLAKVVSGFTNATFGITKVPAGFTNGRCGFAKAGFRIVHRRGGLGLRPTPPSAASSLALRPCRSGFTPRSPTPRRAGFRPLIVPR